MSRTLVVGLGAVALMVACSRPPAAAQSARRMEIRAVTGNTVQFIPAPDQLPYCLVYTQSEKGVTRQLTMNNANTSVACPAGEPVLGRRFRIPLEEGKVQVEVLFSDQRLDATLLAAQVVEMAKPTFNPMDLRLPGRVVLESMEFAPSDEPAPVVGEVVAHPPPDAGGSRH
jgi:hypothetical protein